MTEAKKAAPKKPTTPKQGENGVYWIVNKSGTVHNCDRDHARWRLTQIGYRPATPDEIAKYLDLKGSQHSRQRIAKPHKQEIEEVLTGLDEFDNED